MTGARFNLLPHREMSRRHAWRVFSRQAIVAVCAALLVALVGTWVAHNSVANEISYRQELIQAIQHMAPLYEESLELEKHYQKMVQRQKVIEGLDARRSTSVLILNDVATALPREIFLLRISEDGLDFVVEGKSVNAAAVARFLERLSDSAYLQQMTLGELRIKDPETSAPYQFSIAGKVRLANDVQLKSERGSGQ